MYSNEIKRVKKDEQKATREVQQSNLKPAFKSLIANGIKDFV